MDDESFSWPNEKEVLFKSDGEWWSRACIDANFSSYSGGYKIAADLLVEYIERTCSEQDFLVYPICFLYRHYLELELKYFIGYCNILLENGWKYPEHHHLDKIWGDLRSLINELTESFGEGMWGKDINKELEVIGDYVKQFREIDKESITFRYPFPKKQGKKGAQLRYEKHLTGFTHIDLKNLYDKMQKIYNFFIGAKSLLIEYIEIMNDLAK